MSESADLIKQMIAQTPDWRRKTFVQLRKIVRAADPEITEEVKWRMPSNPLGVPVWERGGIICVCNILKASVRLTFSAGPHLPDPKKLFNSRMDSKAVRAIDFFEGEPINEAALTALVRAGVRYNLAKAKTAKARKSK